jgi:leucyl-tRNA synthetase
VLGSEKSGKLAQQVHEDYKLLWLEPDEAISYWEARNKNGDYSHWINFLRRGVTWLVKAGIDTTHKSYGAPLVYIGEGTLVNSGKFDDADSEKAKWDITKSVGGIRKTQYRLRDWLISRQRYWGPPIPIIYCRKCWETLNSKLEILNKSKIQNPKPKEGVDYVVIDGQEYVIHPVPEEDLPVKLPNVKEFRPTGTDKSPLATVETFYKVRCPKCKKWARRETDVSDTFLDSAWYYLGYITLGNQKSKIKNQKFIPNETLLKKWLPVDMYIGGAEHAVLHLLYVRFLAMAMKDWGVLHFEEPFKKFRAHGLLIKDGAKMSKSRGNVVNPDEYIKAYGADALRMYLMFLGPFEQGGDFQDTGIRGITRFLEKAWKFVHLRQESRDKRRGANGHVDRTLHKTIKKVTEDIESLQYNTAISALMILLNEFEKDPRSVSQEHILTFLKLLAPFAPHITEELAMSYKLKAKSLHKSEWPTYDPNLIQEETFELVIQVNGKVRDKFEVPMDISKVEAEKSALEREKIKSILGVKKPQKVIFVPHRLVNIVV